MIFHLSHKPWDGLFVQFGMSTVFGCIPRTFDYSGSLVVDDEFYVGFRWWCLMSMESSSSPFSPNDLRIFRGDDWIAFSHQNRRSFSIPVSGELSASHKGRFDSIKSEDTRLFERYRQRNPFRFLFKLVDWCGWNRPIRVYTQLINSRLISRKLYTLSSAET